MPLDTTAAFVQALQRSGVLEATQLEELARWQTSVPDPKVLARELIQRGWLTPFQVNQLFQGRESLVLDQYVLLERLGEGGMGQVFKARHRRLKRVIALKVIRKDKLSHAAAVQRFHQEAEAAARVSHPNIVTIHDASEAGGTHFLAMEYVEGIDLAKLVKQCGPLPIAQACAYIRQAALGLQHAHDRGLVHRDIKPSNLFVNLREGVVKVLDMGLARLHVVENDADTSGGLTQTGAVIGTPDYVAPEQAKNSHHADLRADIYSLGGTLYFLLAGRPPFPGGTLTEKLLKIHLDDPESVDRIRPEVPPELAAVVRKMLAKRPEDRYQAAAEAARALEAFATVSDNSATLAITPRDAANGLPNGRPGRRRLLARLLVPHSRGHGLLLGAVALLLAGFLASSWIFRGTPLDRLDPSRIPVAERFFWQTPDVVAVFGEHRFQHWGPVRCLAVSADGKLVASGGADRIIHIWDALTGQARATCKGHTTTIVALAFLNDGKTLVSGSAQSDAGELKLWDIASGKEKSTLQTSLGVTSLSCSADGRHLATVSGNICKIWDLLTEKVQGSFTSRNFTVTAVAFAPVGDALAAACSDHVIRLINHETAKPTFTFKGKHAAVISALAFAADGKTLISGSHDRTAKLWNVDSGEEIVTYRGHTAEIFNVALTVDGKTAASCGNDRSLCLWDAASAETLATLSSNAEVHALAFAPDSHALFSGGNNRTIRIWDVPSGHEKSLRKLHTGRATCVTFAPDGKTLASGGADQLVKFWDVPLKRKFPPIKAHTAEVLSLAFSPDSRRLASGSGDGVIRLWDVATGQVGDNLVGHGASVTAVAFAPDGKRLFSLGGYDLKVWDADAARLRHSHRFPAGNYSTLTFLPASEQIALASGTELKLVELASGQVKNSFKISKNYISSLAYSSPLHTLAVGTMQNQVQSHVSLRDPDSGNEKAHLEHPNGVLSVAFSPHGLLLASAGLDGRILLWDPVTAQMVHEWKLPGPVFHVAFAADNRHLAGANADGTVYVFRLPRGLGMRKK